MGARDLRLPVKSGDSGRGLPGSGNEVGNQTVSERSTKPTRTGFDYAMLVLQVMGVVLPLGIVGWIRRWLWSKAAWVHEAGIVVVLIAVATAAVLIGAWYKRPFSSTPKWVRTLACIFVMVLAYSAMVYVLSEVVMTAAQEDAKAKSDKKIEEIQKNHEAKVHVLKARIKDLDERLKHALEKDRMLMGKQKTADALFPQARSMGRCLIQTFGTNGSCPSQFSPATRLRGPKGYVTVHMLCEREERSSYCGWVYYFNKGADLRTFAELRFQICGKPECSNRLLIKARDAEGKDIALKLDQFMFPHKRVPNDWEQARILLKRFHIAWDAFDCFTLATNEAIASTEQLRFMVGGFKPLPEEGSGKD